MVIYGQPNNLLKKLFSHHRYLNVRSKQTPAKSIQTKTKTKTKKGSKQTKKTQRLAFANDKISRGGKESILREYVFTSTKL